MPHKKNMHITILFTVLLVVFAGCSDNPTAPTNTTERVPSAPTGVKVTNGPGAYVTWKPVKPTKYVSITGKGGLPWPIYYNIYWSTTPGVTKKNGNKIPRVLSPARFNPDLYSPTYYIVITAENEHGESTESEEVVSDWRPQ